MFDPRLNVCRLMCVGLLLSPLGINARVVKKTQTSQQKAEAIADGIMERFYETLDFETVYKEFYVSGNLRNAEVEIIFNNFTNHGLGPHLTSRGKPQIDFAAKERAYVALANFRWLASAALITLDGDDAKLKEDTKQALIRYYEPLNNKSTWPILTSEQVDTRITSRLNELASFFRRHVVQKNFRNETYKARSLRVEESQPPESEKDLKYLFAGQGLSTDAKIYVARRERFFIYLLEQRGAFKMLSFTDRIRF
jgi:hypothetical protein